MTSRYSTRRTTTTRRSADDVEVQYKADNYYAPECDGNIAWNDPDIAVAWPLQPVILSDKDQKAPTLKERAAESLNFVYGE